MAQVKSFTILIVDDEVELCDLIARSFELKGARTLRAYSGQGAFEILKTTPVNAVLSDIRMPSGSGIDLANWIRQSNIVVPFFAFMTGFSDLTETEAEKLGANAFYNKPFSSSKIIAEVLSRFNKATGGFTS